MEVRGQGAQRQFELSSTSDPDRILEGAATTKFGTASNAQYGCQAFAGMNGAERPFNQDASYSGVPFPNTYGDGQVQPIGTCEMGDQLWFDWDLFMRPLGNLPVS
jgi:hypothetical protein